MLRIGEFSKLSKVSVRMLRYYDCIGLLKPTVVDNSTGYRLYEPSQLKVIGKITALKDMGFSLSDIIRVLEIYEDRDQLNEYLEIRRAELERTIKETRYRIRLLDSAQRMLRKEQSMRFDVLIKTIPERYAATVRMIIPHAEDEALAWQILCEETESLHLISDDSCLVAASYLDDEFKEENLDILVWKTVKGTYPDTKNVKFCKLPEVKVASCTVKGSYEQMNDCYAAVIEWVKDNGYEADGPMFNLYHVSPYETDDPDEFVTEVCYPVK